MSCSGRKAPLVAAAAALLCACGPQEQGGPGLELVLSRAYVDRLASFQVAVLAHADTLDQLAVERTCVSSQGLTYVRQLDDAGKQVNARTFAAALASGQQELKLQGIPFGREYLFVVEALSGDATPALLGSGSVRVQSFQGDARPNPISVEALTPTPGCDPRIR